MVENFKLDKKFLSVSQLTDPTDDKGYWHSRTPHERLPVVEHLRQLNYGHRQSTARLQRILEIAQRHKDLDDLENLP